MTYNRVSLMLVIFPLCTNWTLAIFAFFVSFNDFANSPDVCYMTLVTACFGVLTSVVGFAFEDLGPGRALAAAVLQGFALLFVFAGIYRGYGLMYGGDIVPMGQDWAGALYFSIVTWTTVGYGDFTPPAAIRLIAATQALLGYLVFGTTVGLGTYFLIERRM